MLKLRVSYNCGIDYAPVEWFELDEYGRAPSYIQEKMENLNSSMLRWYVEDEETGEIVKDFMCAIHADIIFTMEALNK